jgi:hypothetical protein
LRPPKPRRVLTPRVSPLLHSGTVNSRLLPHRFRITGARMTEPHPTAPPSRDLCTARMTTSSRTGLRTHPEVDAPGLFRLTAATIGPYGATASRQRSEVRTQFSTFTVERGLQLQMSAVRARLLAMRQIFFAGTPGVRCNEHAERIVSVRRVQTPANTARLF